MQNTRLNQLIDRLINQLNNWLSNPWRRWSLLLMSLLFGFFFGEVVASSAGQAARWDVTGAAVLVVVVEVVSWVAYTGRVPREIPPPNNFPTAFGSPIPPNDRAPRFLLLEMANNFKVGLTYSLFLEAFKLGS